ncbi:MAG: DEAD/DEAH box helicase [Ktedonobacteraceae bacterium]
MVDFKKRLSNKRVEAVIDPVKLYDTLDRTHDKGPLRPAQIAVLEEWFNSRCKERDVIVKLHTGQGKTLIGLLMLQSCLNRGQGPALYLCPDNFLVKQTCEQARQFGIATCVANPELPTDFLDSKTILVTTVQKLFNGRTKFKLSPKSKPVGVLLMDDAHACSDEIREACRLRLPKSDPAYDALKRLFAPELEQQGVGTYADIVNNKYDAFLPVPYWAWMEHESEVAGILSSGEEREDIKFTWPILKNILRNCQCIVSGAAIEIEPYIPPLQAFGTYWNAPHRIFMSATVTDDAFLVKGIQLSPKTIQNPLTYENERWSGEKMVLIPSQMREGIERGRVVTLFGKSDSRRKYGVVALVSSFDHTKDWKKCGATVADKATVGLVLEKLQLGNFEPTVVLVNRYDGIDLPDDACRILILDMKPYSESLIDLYQEACRPDSEATLMRTVRHIEQGLGRSVRGEKDYSVIVITGTDLTRLLLDKSSRKYLSSQMSTQIEIGNEIAEMVAQDIKAGETTEVAFKGLIDQCLNRDDGWKQFYQERMEAVKPSGANERMLQLYAEELVAERQYLLGNYTGAVSKLQLLLDSGLTNTADRGWYLQEMARYNYRSSRSESERLQISAYTNNQRLLLPREGITVAKITAVSQGRMERIIAWIRKYDNYQELNIALSDVLGRLGFGIKADKFEQALDELSYALGFVGERPDKKWKQGPDNLWALDDTQYILWECKNEVYPSRQEIHERETEQMNRSCAWFGKYYIGSSVKNIIVHPSDYVSSAAAFTHEVEVMRERELKRLVETVRGFYKSFETQDFHDLSPVYIQKLVDAHNLSTSAILSNYATKLRNIKRDQTKV